MGLFTQEAKTDYNVPVELRMAEDAAKSQRQFTDTYLDPAIKENIGYESPRMMMKSIAQGADLSNGKSVEQAYKAIQAINPQEANAWLTSIKPVIKQYVDRNGGSDQKKWDFEQRGKRDAIRREAEARGFSLTEAEINDIAISTPLSSKMNQLTGRMIHPWMDILEAKLQGKEPLKVKTPASTPTPSSVTTAATSAADIKSLESMNTQFGVETKATRENINTIESGLNIVNQVRDGNTSSMPQLERMLAKFNSDNRISVPEVKQVMKIGGLGDRITNSIERFISGDLSPGTLNDIEEMLVRMGQLDQKNYNSKVSDYKSRYSDRFDQDTLSQWLKPSDKKFYTQEQQRELYEQEMKKRGLK